MSENERFGFVFATTGSINSGTGQLHLIKMTKMYRTLLRGGSFYLWSHWCSCHSIYFKKTLNMYKDCKPVSLKVLHNMNGNWSKALSTGPGPVVDPDVFLYLNLVCIRPLTEKPNLL